VTAEKITLTAENATNKDMLIWVANANGSVKYAVLVEKTGAVQELSDLYAAIVKEAQAANAPTVTPVTTNLTHATAAYNKTSKKIIVTPDTGYEFTSATDVTATPVSSKTVLDSATKETDGTITIPVTTLPANDSVVLTGGATAKTYTITYNVSAPAGVQAPSVANTTYKVTDGSVSLAAPTLTGYKFSGWYTDATYTTAKTSVSPSEATDLTLYGKFEEDTVSLTVEIYDGTSLVKTLNTTALRGETVSVATDAKLARVTIGETVSFKAQADQSYTTPALTADSTTVKIEYVSKVKINVVNETGYDTWTFTAAATTNNLSDSSITLNAAYGSAFSGSRTIAYSITGATDGSSGSVTQSFSTEASKDYTINISAIVGDITITVNSIS
jgi:uncharacterized repeat protein (TIGR02543 family)